MQVIYSAPDEIKTLSTTPTCLAQGAFGHGGERLFTGSSCSLLSLHCYRSLSGVGYRNTGSVDVCIGVGQAFAHACKKIWWQEVLLFEGLGVQRTEDGRQRTEATAEVLLLSSVYRLRVLTGLSYRRYNQ